MSVFVTNFYKLCTMKKIAPTAALSEMGVGRSVFKKWKDGSTPHEYTAHRVADYFGVTVEDMNNPDFSPSPSLFSKETQSEQAEMLEELRRRPSMRTLFSLAKDATDEEINTAIKIIVALKK